MADRAPRRGAGGRLEAPLADFRKLTPLVLAQALERAGTAVCEPTVRASLGIPTEAIRAVMPALAPLGAAIEPTSLGERRSLIAAVLPPARLSRLARQLPDLTDGDGVLEPSFAGYQPASGDPATRRAKA